MGMVTYQAATQYLWKSATESVRFSLHSFVLWGVVALILWLLV